MTRYTLLLFSLLLIVGIAAAADTLTVPNTGLHTGDESTVNVALSAEDGLSGYNVTFTITDDSVAEIQSVTFPSWATLNSATSTPAASVTTVGADLADTITAPANTVIVTLTLKGLSVGTTTLTATVNQIDDDSGGTVTPSVSNATLTVTYDELHDRVYDSMLYAGINTLPATNASLNEVTLNGNTTEELTVWFIYGGKSNTYAFCTSNQTDIDGTFDDDLTGIPLIPGETFYYRAACAYGYGEEESFTLDAMTPFPTTTHGAPLEEFLDSGGDWETMAGISYSPYYASWGDLFVTILISLVFIGLSLKQGSVAIPTMLGFLVGFPLFCMMIPEAMKIAQGLIIISVAGVIYWIFEQTR